MVLDHNDTMDDDDVKNKEEFPFSYLFHTKICNCIKIYPKVLTYNN